MSEKLSRRRFLRLAGLGAAALLADGTYATRALFPDHEIGQAEAIFIQEAIPHITPYLEFQNLETITFNGKSLAVQPNPEAFATTLLFYGFSEEGIKGVTRIANFIQERKLQIIADSTMVGGGIRPSFGKNRPAQLSLGANEIGLYVNGNKESEGTIDHELYHVHQNTRFPDLFDEYSKGHKAATDILTLLATIQGGRLSFKKISKILSIVENPSPGRRLLINIDRVITTMFSAALSYGAMRTGIEHLTPTELQAYLQTDTNLGVLDHPLYQQMKQPYFTVQ